MSIWSARPVVINRGREAQRFCARFFHPQGPESFLASSSKSQTRSIFLRTMQSGFSGIPFCQDGITINIMKGITVKLPDTRCSRREKSMPYGLNHRSGKGLGFPMRSTCYFFPVTLLRSGC